MKSYPSFIPPDQIGVRQPEDWSNVEAKKYYDWLLLCINERTSFLVEYFGEQISSAPDVLLRRLGEKASQAIQSPPFLESKAGPTLSDAGFALAADMGLLVARLLLAERDVDAKWVLVKAKSSINYNQPVLRGQSNVAFNPVFGSVTDVAYAFKNELKIESDRWLKSYQQWKDSFSSKSA